MIAPARFLVTVLVALAMSGGVAACGDSNDSGGSGAAGGGKAGGGSSHDGGNGNGNGNGAAVGKTDGGGGQDSAAEQEKDEEVVDEQPSTNNQVLLGAAFSGEQPADFGVVALGMSRTMTFTVKNLAQVRTILGTSLVGDHAGDFSLDPGTCADGAELAEGGNCTVGITFTPTAEGERLASLRIALDPGVLAGRSIRGGPPATRTTTETTETTTTEATRTTEPGDGERVVEDDDFGEATTTAP